MGGSELEETSQSISTGEKHHATCELKRHKVTFYLISRHLEEAVDNVMKKEVKFVLDRRFD